MASKSPDFGLSRLGCGMLSFRPGQTGQRGVRLPGSPLAWSASAAFAQRRVWVSRARLLLCARWARRRLEVRFLRKLAGLQLAPGGGGRTLKAEAGLRGMPRGERSWAWGNRISSPPGRTGPLCGGPSSCADPSPRTIAQCCRPPGQALRVTLRPPKARKPGGAFL